VRPAILPNLTILLPLLAVRAALGISSTNIQDVYTNIGFDHTAPDSGVIVQLTDIHFCSLGDKSNFYHEYWDPPAITNMINLRMPRATQQVLIVTGDLSQSNSDYGSQQPHPGAGMEFEWAKRALDCVTNIDWYYAGRGTTTRTIAIA
jgi:hypothetical protein